MRKLIGSIFAIILFGACTSVDCPVDNRVAVVYKLSNSDNTQMTLIDTLTIATRIANGTDSILLNRSVETSEFTLPVSLTNECDTFTFERKGNGYAVTDTVWMEKTNLPQFESVDCNLVYFHDVTEITHTHHGIDSIYVNKRRIDYDSNTEHFRIYFKTGM